MKVLLVISFALLVACQPKVESSSFEVAPGSRFMTEVSDEIVIDSEPTIDDNLFKATEIVRAVCEEGFYSVPCADPSNYPPMQIDRDNLLPVELEVNLMAASEPNYVYIRCSTDMEPPPVDLVNRCYQLVVEKIRL